MNSKQIIAESNPEDLLTQITLIALFSNHILIHQRLYELRRQKSL